MISPPSRQPSTAAPVRPSVGEPLRKPWKITHYHFKTVLLQRPLETTQYSSEDFRRQLKALGVTCSMSRSGDVWDTSVMESFFSTLKIERVHRKRYATRDAARADVFDYIERFYNPVRRHSTLGNRSPVVFEQEAVVA